MSGFVYARSHASLVALVRGGGVRCRSKAGGLRTSYLRPLRDVCSFRDVRSFVVLTLHQHSSQTYTETLNPKP